MPRRPLTELQMQLIARAQRDSGRGVIYAISPEAHAMAQAFADGRTEQQPEPKPKRTWFTDAEVTAMYARWNNWNKRQPAGQEG